MKTKIIIIFTALLSFSLLTSLPAKAQSSQNYILHCTSYGCSCQETNLNSGDSVYSSLEACENTRDQKNKNLKGSSDVNNLQCNGNQGINTALGCIPTNLQGDGFIKNILTLGIGIGGAIALILIVYGLFLITTSGGIPDKVNAGKEVITSAIAGLIFIIFSTILMNIIGINILGLPGLQ